MSLPILNQVADEMRRLALAGASVAPGDFRLKKLLPQLEAAGAKAPVFAKVHDTAKAVVESNEGNAAAALLDLTTLVNAIRYTQGTTAVPGELAPVKTRDLKLPSKQTSARTMKPLLEALTNTGGGRFEVVKDAYENGLFVDLRLVQPAVDALADPYSEIADLITQKVLPMFGPSIVPLVMEKLDVKGKAANARRLTVLHALDPVAARPFVEQALEEGTKDVRVAAVACLGADARDLPILLEQAKAKAQDVRTAAYQALATVNHPDAHAVLEKVFAGDEVRHISHGLRASAPGVHALHLAACRSGVKALFAAKDKKAIGKEANRLMWLFRGLQTRTDNATAALFQELFALQEQFLAAKGETTGTSGSDVFDDVVTGLFQGSDDSRKLLAANHAKLDDFNLSRAFQSARMHWPAAKVYDEFSAYFLKSPEAMKLTKKALSEKVAMIVQSIQRFRHYGVDDDEAPPTKLDPRWMDLALKVGNVEMLRCVIQPGHAKANAWLSEAFKKAKTLDDAETLVNAMIDAEHPEMVACYLSRFEKLGKSHSYQQTWYCRRIQRMPKSAIPALEAALPGIPESARDAFVESLERLRNL